MTLLMYILSLSLTFICSSYEECINIRGVTYEYILPPAEEELVCGYDYIIRESITFADVDGVITVKTNDYEIPILSDYQQRDWQQAIALIANERGVDIVEYKDASAVGKVSEQRLDAYKDIYKDGFANHMSTLDYLDERELSEQRTRYTVIFVSFSFFFTFAKLSNGIFAYWIKPKYKV